MKTRAAHPLVSLALLLTLASGCRGQNSAQSLPTTQMTLGTRTFTIELALTDSQQETGLMFRDSMPADHGMIFVFPDEQVRNFWMKNTHIPLDIVYCDAQGKIVAIKSMKPYDLTSVSSDRPAKYAIELNVTIATMSGLHVGDIIAMPQNFSGSNNATTAPSTQQ